MRIDLRHQTLLPTRGAAKRQPRSVDLYVTSTSEVRHIISIESGEVTYEARNKSPSSTPSFSRSRRRRPTFCGGYRGASITMRCRSPLAIHAEWLRRK